MSDTAAIASARELFERSFGASIEAIIAGLIEANKKNNTVLLASCIASCYQIGKNLEPLYMNIDNAPAIFHISGNRTRDKGVGAGDTIRHNYNGGALRAGGFAMLAASTHPRAREAMNAKGNPLLGQILGSENARGILQEMSAEHAGGFKQFMNDPELKEVADRIMYVMFPVAPAVPTARPEGQKKAPA